MDIEYSHYESLLHEEIMRMRGFQVPALDVRRGLLPLYVVSRISHEVDSGSFVDMGKLRYDRLFCGELMQIKEPQVPD